MARHYTKSELPSAWIDRFRHYFLSYKDLPGIVSKTVEIEAVYQSAEARIIIKANVTDYQNLFRK